MDAVELLVAGGAAVVGIDSVNIDDTRTGERPVHTALLGAGIPIVEHLRGLDGLRRRDVHVHRRAASGRRDGDVPGAGAGAHARRLSQPAAAATTWTAPMAARPAPVASPSSSRPATTAPIDATPSLALARDREDRRPQRRRAVLARAS